MGIWKKPQSANSPETKKSARPATRQHADGIRRKAQCYTDITEQTGDQSDDRCKATLRREQAEREMAALRAEALQARRLATQIENLHQPASPQRRGRLMDTTTKDPGQAQRVARRTTDNPSPGGGKMNFNPLHPSMELPPEHLIRLLGLENKTKRRKKRPVPAISPAREKASIETMLAEAPLKLTPPKIPPARAEREKDTPRSPFEAYQRQWLIPSLVAGTIAGTIISAYLFWSEPETTTTPVTHATLPDKTRVKPTAAPTIAPAPTTREGRVERTTEVIPQAKIDVEEARLRAEAEQRFTQRLADQRTPDTDTAVPAPVEPSIDENFTPVPEQQDTSPAMAKDVPPVVKSAADTNDPATVQTDMRPRVEEQIAIPETPGHKQPGSAALPGSVNGEALTTPPLDIAPAIEPESKATTSLEITTTMEADDTHSPQDIVPEETVSEDLF